MKLEKEYTCYRVVETWNGECPVCGSKNKHSLFTGEGSWYVQYRCEGCNTRYAFNQGDAMGGQSDYMEIYEPNK